ncbi:FHA domain-containing protein [Flammeovirga sp. SubArs3]|uniref:FHA domain-containing protein n=1 Tax=Flammeovirga sp. SubArs3 TaxID=2995316 RepID=UPI00248ACE8A|nr:FHA domain-containing protein [Flammeovirga sp. SubArs3]
MKFKCNNCKVLVSVKNEAFQKKNQLKIKCPKCSTINVVKFTPPPQEIEKTVVHETNNTFSTFNQVNEAPQNTPEKNGEKAVGWLIVHTEDKEHLSFPLFLGINKVGRKSEQNIPEVPLEGDKYVSRIHCYLEIIKRGNATQIILADNGKFSGGRCSTNGTYVNGNEKRLNEKMEVIIQENDTIQIGRTKLVFKGISNQDVHTVIDEVANSDFQKTIIQ